MLIAGEASGDQLGAELVQALREESAQVHPLPTQDYQPLYGTFEPRFFGAGGPRMAAAGVDLALDLTAHAVIGLSEAMKHYLKFRQIFRRLFKLALERQPDAIICIDFSGFNRRFAHAIRRYTRSRQDWFHAWNPKLIQYVSPQVWASRERRAYQMAKDYDLLLSIFPFEPDWYAERVPDFNVEFVGHPLIDRYAEAKAVAQARSDTPRTLLLLPGSRRVELKHHLPVMADALAKIRAGFPNLRVMMVFPNEQLARKARESGLVSNVEIQVGGLPEALAVADLAIASTGTVTLECAFFGVPTVALYKTAWINYEIAKRIAKVKYLAMPNLLTGEEIFPEFIQNPATPENIAATALDLLRDANKRKAIRARLAGIIDSLGHPGAPRRAARAVARLFSRSEIRANVGSRSLAEKQ
jgi:lipid-A-disaccharide synthase